MSIYAATLAAVIGFNVLFPIIALGKGIEIAIFMARLVGVYAADIGSREQ